VTAFATAAAALATARAEPELLGPLTEGTGMRGAAVTTLGNPFGSETRGASDPGVASFSERQVDLGVGPAWDALRTGRPVLLPDLRSVPPDRWPAVLPALLETGLRAVFCFPMHVGGIDVGAVTVHGPIGASLSPGAVRDATALTAIAARRVLQITLHHAEQADDPEGMSTPFSRHDVHQATGMIAAQLRVTVEEALLVIRARAYHRQESVRDLAARVIARDVDLRTWDDGESEDEEHHDHA
jgi:GAF domain-containing protein